MTKSILLYDSTLLKNVIEMFKDKGDTTEPLYNCAFNQELKEMLFSIKKEFPELKSIIDKKLLQLGFTDSELDLDIKFMAYHGDINLSLRQIGDSEPSLVITTDEGDGIEFSYKKEKVSHKCIDEWILQLFIIISHLQGLKNVI